MSGETVHLGLAIGPDAVWVGQATGPARSAGRWTPRMIALDDVSRDSLAQAFESLRRELDSERAVLHVALMPPLVQARRIELPRLKLNEVRRILTHGAKKYFFGAREPHMVGVRIIRARRQSPMPLFAVAAPTCIVNALFDAADHVGWQIDTIVSAYDVWAQSLSARSPKTPPAPTWIVHCHPEFVEGILVDGGKPTLVRKTAAGPATGDAVSEWMSIARADEPRRVPVRLAVLGEEHRRGPILSHELTHDTERIEVQADEVDPPALAAAHVVHTAGTEILPDRVRAQRVQRARRWTVVLSAGALVLLGIAASVELWGARRQLNAMQRERAALAERVGATVAEREVLLELNQRLASLATAEETAPRWSGVIANVAQNLPEDAHLLAFRASADSLVMEGLAERAAGVFEAMQAAPDILGVRARSPIRRELVSDNRAIERFALGAQLAGEGSR